MAYKEVSDLSTDTTISLGGTNRKTGKKNPSSIEGYYIGSREVADAKKKSGKSFIHIFQTPEGNVGVWGKTDLDRKITPSLLGTMVKASFEKMVPTPNGEMYKFKVQFDPENTTEVTGTTYTDSSAEYNGVTEREEFDEENEDNEDEAQALALAAAERKAKVAALLSKSKNVKA